MKQAKAALDACMAEYESEKLDVKSNVHNIFIDLYYTQQKLKVYDKEIASLEKIYHAYEQQSEKGNVSKMQLFRISAMISELCAEQASLMMTRADLQKELNLHINMSEDSQIVVEMDEEDMLRYVTNTLAKLTPFVTHQDKNSLSALLKQHPVMAQMAYQQKKLAALVIISLPSVPQSQSHCGTEIEETFVLLRRNMPNQYWSERPKRKN